MLGSEATAVGRRRGFQASSRRGPSDVTRGKSVAPTIGPIWGTIDPRTSTGGNTVGRLAGAVVSVCAPSDPAPAARRIASATGAVVRERRWTVTRVEASFAVPKATPRDQTNPTRD